MTKINENYPVVYCLSCPSIEKEDLDPKKKIKKYISELGDIGKKTLQRPSFSKINVKVEKSTTNHYFIIFFF